MPLYEYQCEECSVRFERTQSFKDQPLTSCPECEGKVHRVIGATGIIFKGSGFYVTDSRKSNSTSTSKNSTADKAGGETKSETKSESNTETKTEAKSEAKAESKAANPS
jgi:putative FmdB family regulatory protein